ncbi:MAG: porin, partial [Rhodobacterales bacterium]|nr:porin [Rhodobacterales bacterium]
MKKHLLSTSAIALGVAMAAPVAAQEWDVSFGGFMSQHIAFTDNSVSTSLPGVDNDGFKIHSSSEVHFTPSITLDNGLTFGVNIELEGENSPGSQIDESYMTISSDTLGRIVIGSENSAGYTLMTSAPVVTSMAINSPSISSFIPFSAAYPGGFRQAGISSFTEVAGNNDAQRLTYYTPSFNGLTLGVSWAPDTSATNSYGLDRNSGVTDIFDIGVNYSQTFGTTSVTLSARYGVGNMSNIAAGDPGVIGTVEIAPGVFEDVYGPGTPAVVGSDPETWGVGAQVGFGAFAVGGSYAENDNGFAGGVGDSRGWNLGMTYDIAGPWALEAVT